MRSVCKIRIILSKEPGPDPLRQIPDNGGKAFLSLFDFDAFAIGKNYLFLIAKAQESKRYAKIKMRAGAVFIKPEMDFIGLKNCFGVIE